MEGGGGGRVGRVWVGWVGWVETGSGLAAGGLGQGR